jgi:hypothetical protein
MNTFGLSHIISNRVPKEYASKVITYNFDCSCGNLSTLDFPNLRKLTISNKHHYAEVVGVPKGLLELTMKGVGARRVFQVSSPSLTNLCLGVRCGHELTIVNLPKLTTVYSSHAGISLKSIASSKRLHTVHAPVIMDVMLRDFGIPNVHLKKLVMLSRHANYNNVNVAQADALSSVFPHLNTLVVLDLRVPNLDFVRGFTRLENLLVFVGRDTQFTLPLKPLVNIATLEVHQNGKCLYHQ